MRTNAPKMITIVLALALTVAGLSATLLPIAAVNELIAASGYSLTQQQGWWALLASPVLLIVGSLLPGV